MFKNPRIRFNALYRQRKFILIASCLSAVSLVMLFGYKSGPAKNGQAVTGAPFNSSQTCAKCHSGGSYGGAIKTQLLDSANKVVKTYVPGRKYTLKIFMSKTSTTTVKYAFQTTAATATTNLNINKWGTLPANTHNTLLSGHNYVEQSTVLTNATTKIPWIGPVKGTGSVKFYTAGNLVNNTGGTTGDQPVNAVLTVTESVAFAPLAINNLTGNIRANNAAISWSTADENNVHSFIVEKSTNSNDFKEAGIVMAKGGGDYTFNDFAFDNKAYYRIKITDTKGATSYSEPLNLTRADKLNYKLGLYGHAGYAYVQFSNGGKAQKVQVLYTDMQGRSLSSGATFANEGDNIWEIPKGSVKGIVIINVITEDGIRTSMKFNANQ